MKKLLWILLTLFFASCAQTDDYEEMADGDPVPQSPYQITQEQALDNLYAFLGQAEPGTRSEARRRIGRIETVSGTGFVTRSAEPPAKNLVYIVHFEDGQGYALLAADERLDPVIAVTEGGTLSAADFSFSGGSSSPTRSDGLSVGGDDNGGNIGGPILGPILEDYIDEQINGGGDDEEPELLPPPTGGILGDFYNKHTDWKLYSKVFPKLKTKWGQRSPFNNKINEAYHRPSGSEFPSGCVAIAVAQIMAYNRHPDSSQGIRFNWEGINTITYPSASGVYPGNMFHINVAHLVYVVAEGCDMDYGISESSSNIRKAKQCLKNMGYPHVDKHVGYNEDRIMAMLRADKPVYIRAERDGNNGHAWVIDGYIQEDYYLYVPTGRYRYVRTFMHCNFGWCGDHDGYYASRIFTLTSGSQQRETSIGDKAAGHSAGNSYTHDFAHITYDKP